METKKIGHYEIVEELGRGGMGVVYKGYEPALGRYVAIKQMSQSLAHDPSIVERFLREARSMAQLNDPHIIQIYFVGEQEGQPYFAMEFVEGESVSQRLKRERRIAPMDAAQILLQTAQGLATAHDKGVIHRDIKPANLMINNRGVVKVADFGIALAQHDVNKKLTGTGQFVGTPGYLSPEVCLGKPVDPRSDLFSLGVVFYEMLTGQMPFTDNSPLGMMLEVVQAQIPDVRALNAEVDPRLAAILAKLVAKNPDDRYPNCQALIADLIAAGVNARSTPVTPLSLPNLAKATANAPTIPVSPAEAATRAATPAPAPVRPVGPPPLAPQPPASPIPGGGPPPAPAPAASRANLAVPLALAATLVLLLGAAGFLGWRWLQPAPATLGGSTASTPPVALAPAPSAAGPAMNDTAAAIDPATATANQAPNAAGAAIAAAEPAVVDPTASAQPAAADPAPTELSAAVPATTAGRSDAVVGGAMATSSEPSGTARPTLDAAPSGPAVAQHTGAAIPPAYQSAGAVDTRMAQVERPRAVPPPAAPKRPAVPRVLILAFGDRAASIPAEQALSDALREAGFQVVDAELVSGMSGFRGAREVDFPRLLAFLRNNGVSEAVVAIQITPQGAQELAYYGQSSTVYTAQLQIRAMSVDDRQSLGRWSSTMMFSSLNAADVARESIGEHLAAIKRSLAPYRARS